MRRSRRPSECRLITWNVAGLRGLLAKQPHAISDLVAAEAPDVLCLQETKLQTQHVEDVAARLGLGPEWEQIWECSTRRLGHAGVAVLTRLKPRSVVCGLPALGELASGRVISVVIAGFRLVNTYSPNAGDGLKNIALRVEQFDPALAQHVRAGAVPTILTGDMNVAPEAEDVYDPVRLGRLQAPGFSDQERQSFRKNFCDPGLVDAFRALHPQVRAYSFYSYRGAMRPKGRGWRLDHFLVPQSLMPQVTDCFIMEHTVGSDHLPVGLSINGVM